MSNFFESFMEFVMDYMLAIGIAIVLFLAAWLLAYEVIFCCGPDIYVECTLLNNDYHPSTQRTHIAPIISSSGKMSTAVYTTGNPKSYTTVWDCGEYGRLVCTNKKVYQYAKDKSTLIIKHTSYETRIMGIVKDLSK